ncbi:MAG TPA: hypothetical protein VN598_17820, partial [Usitatibacter sp.]|nr:hypothetical protein [Usitatibacter sp.]
MRASRIILAVLVLAAIVAAGLYFFWPSAPPPPPPPPAPAAPAAPTGPRYPVTTQSDQPLPTLAASDPAVIDALQRLLGPQVFAQWIVTEGLIRNIVATVDNLPREHFARRLSPLNGLGGTFKTTGSG